MSGPRATGASCVVGLQWGDEAKGKIVDVLGDDHDFVVRFNGGNNAGHTIQFHGKTFKLSLMPTGVLKPAVTSVIGNGVVVYPPKLLDEIEQLAKAGIEVGTNLRISAHAHVIMPYHVEEEKVNETGAALGTTGRGIGPCYQEKVGRAGAIRLGDLLDPAVLREKLEFIIPKKNRLIAGLHADPHTGAKQFEVEAVATEYHEYGEQLRPFICDTVRLLNDAIDSGKRLLFEGAQGSLLDIDHGTFPYVTSSNSMPGGIWNGAGVSSRRLETILGVVKAYTTRVGRGPFPTELDDGPDGIGEAIRQKGREFGTVTGRPRRCGWFDAVAVKHTARLADVDRITVMLLDVLSGLDELKICTRYTVDGEETDLFPADGAALAKCEPVYETIPSWTEDLTAMRTKGELPAGARRYVERIAEAVGKPVELVSVGPDREQTIRWS